jgi:hypothetical protein
MKNVLGIFKNIESTNVALASLEMRGYSKDDISVVATKEALGSQELQFENNMLKGVTDTAMAGGLLGGFLGLLIGVGALTIPGLGLLFVTGPIATALGITGVAGAAVSGALTGSMVGGIAGALKELGVDESLALEYEQDVKGGNIILGVETEDEDVSDVMKILTTSGATRVSELQNKRTA